MAEKPHTPTRRAALACLAATPVAGLPALAAAGEPDPIFAALTAKERAYAAAKAAISAATAVERLQPKLPPVTFGGLKVCSRAHLETMWHEPMTEAELDSTIADIRAGAEKLRREAPAKRAEFERARATLEARDASHDGCRVAELDEKADAAWEASNEAETAVFDVEPTTPAGAAALIRFALDTMLEEVTDSRVDEAFRDRLRRAVASLELAALRG